MRLMFVCRQFEDMAGGVERMSINIMNAMADRGHRVSLMTWDRTGSKAFFPIDETIHWDQMDMGDPLQKAGIALRVRRMRRFRRYVRERRPETVIGFQHGAFLFAAVSLPGRRVPVILAERNSPDRMDHTSEGRYRQGVFQTMRLATAITVQWESYINRYPGYLRRRIVAIPNPVYEPGGGEVTGEEKFSFTLLSVGRLSYQKNYETLIHSFADLANEFPAWRLRIVGEGEQRPALESQVAQLGLAQRVELAGAARDISSEYRAADLFCLPSRWEGFPNTLAEAMAHGLPCVAFDGCAGANELIEHDRNGRLAGGNGDPDTLTPALRELMGETDGRRRLGEVARDITRQYKPERIYDRWEQLFREVAATR